MSEVTETKGLPEFVSFGEALTDMIRVAPDQWKSVPGGAPWNVAMVMSYFGIPSAFGGAISSGSATAISTKANQRAQAGGLARARLRQRQTEQQRQQ